MWAASPPCHRRRAITTSYGAGSGVGADGPTHRGHGRDNHVTASGGGVPRAPSPPSVLLLHGLFAARRTYPFGLDNTAESLARTICSGAKMYVERPLVLPRDTEAQHPARQAAEELDFS